MRVVVRYRLRTVGDLSAPAGTPSLTDAVGELTAVDELSVTVKTRRGPVRIERELVVAAKEVPPAPARRGAAHLAISATDLEDLMVAGMPPLESRWQGRWLSRAAEGYTGRANSVLPLGDPGTPMTEAVAGAVSWYAEHGQTPLFQLFGPTGFDPRVDALGSQLIADGWQTFQRTLVMTAAVPRIPMTSGASQTRFGIPPETLVTAPGTDENGSRSEAVAIRPAEVIALRQPDEHWWGAASTREREHRDVVDRMNALVPESAFPIALKDRRPVGVARLAFAQGWMGIFSVHVRPEVRGAGIGRLLMQAALAEAAGRGISLAYLQVSADNIAAVRLYESLGFVVHHEYYYARQ